MRPLVIPERERDVKAGAFYAGWYPARWWPFPYTGVSGLHPRLAAHTRRGARTSQRLAR